MLSEIRENIQSKDWTAITRTIHEKGFARITGCIPDEQCDHLASLYNEPQYYRKTIVMERYRFGLGEYKYFSYPLPQPVQLIRELVYPKLAPLANHWMASLRMDQSFPLQLSELHELCKAHQQIKPTPLILKYGEGGYNTLHQDLYGTVYFPLQAVLFLSAPNQDYEGGEFIITEQRPRAQSKASVIRGNKGDLLIFTTNFRPVKGKQQYYRVAMKHGVSEVLKGKRFTLGIIFHDAA